MAKQKKEGKETQNTGTAQEGTGTQNTNPATESNPTDSNPDETQPTGGDKEKHADPKANTLYKRAKEIAREYKVKTVYANSKGEFFTAETYALASEGGKKDKVQTFKF